MPCCVLQGLSVPLIPLPSFPSTVSSLELEFHLVPEAQPIAQRGSFFLFCFLLFIYFSFLEVSTSLCSPLHSPAANPLIPSWAISYGVGIVVTQGAIERPEVLLWLMTSRKCFSKRVVLSLGGVSCEGILVVTRIAGVWGWRWGSLMSYLLWGPMRNWLMGQKRTWMLQDLKCPTRHCVDKKLLFHFLNLDPNFFFFFSYKHKYQASQECCYCGNTRKALGLYHDLFAILESDVIDSSTTLGIWADSAVQLYQSSLIAVSFMETLCMPN